MEAIIYLQPREQKHAHAIKTGVLTNKEYQEKKREEKGEGKSVYMPQAREQTHANAISTGRSLVDK